MATTSHVSAATTCTLVYGVDFTINGTHPALPDVQTVLDAGGAGSCLATADGDTLTLDFDNPLSRPRTKVLTSTLSWALPADLVLRDGNANGTLLDGGSARQILTSTDSAADVAAARLAEGLCNRVFLQPQLEGHYPADVVEASAGITDFGETTLNADLFRRGASGLVDQDRAIAHGLDAPVRKQAVYSLHNTPHGSGALTGRVRTGTNPAISARPEAME